MLKQGIGDRTTSGSRGIMNNSNNLKNVHRPAQNLLSDLHKKCAIVIRSSIKKDYNKNISNSLAYARRPFFLKTSFKSIKTTGVKNALV